MNSSKPIKILMLILATDGEPYSLFQQQWEKIVNSNQNIDCYFYKGDSSINDEIQIINNTILVKIEEKYETVYEKTMRVFKYFYDKLDKYDFIYRPNMSSFIRFDKYLEACKFFPRSNLCAALIGYYHGSMPFPSGSGFTMSCDVLKKIVDMNPLYIYMDDITIGKALIDLNITILAQPRFDILSCVSVDNIPSTFYHYRIKTENRGYDVEIFSSLVKIYYSGKDINNVI